MLFSIINVRVIETKLNFDWEDYKSADQYTIDFDSRQMNLERFLRKFKRIIEKSSQKFLA